MKLSRGHVAYGAEVSVTGTAAAHRRVALQLLAAGHTNWRSVASTMVHGNGSFRLLAPLRTSGQVRVIPAPDSSAAVPAQPAVAPAPATPGAAASGTVTGPTALSPSAPERVTVAAKLRVPDQTLAGIGGQRIDIRGSLLPGIAGRRVALIARSNGRWHRIATARTGRRGGFDLKLVPGDVSGESLRVRFAGDRLNSRTSKPAGHVTALTPAVASWYNDGGATACGFHAQYGVAHKTLPCGTHVTFSYHGRTVAAIVDDRGPFVGGREWDLNQNTAAALGFAGVDTVYASI
jgi:hypothetical protein